MFHRAPSRLGGVEARDIGASTQVNLARRKFASVHKRKVSMRYIWSILLILNGMPYRWCRISNPLVQAEDPHGGMAGYDPSLYASTGSWAGLPYDTPAYGGPPPQGGYGGYAPQSYAPGPPQSYGPPEGFAPMPARGMYGSFRETGPPQQVSMQYVDGPPGPPGGMYRSGYAPRPSYGMPMHETGLIS